MTTTKSNHCDETLVGPQNTWILAISICVSTLQSGRGSSLGPEN